MLEKVVLVLVALQRVGGILTAKVEHTDLRTDIRNVEGKVDDLGEDIDDIGYEIDKLEYEIEDVGEGVEDLETEVENVTAEVVNLREEVKTTRSVLQTGQQDIDQKMTQLAEEVATNGNSMQHLRQDAQEITQGLTSIEATVDGLRYELETKVDGLEGELHVHYQDIGQKMTQLQEHHYEELEYLKASTGQQEDLKAKTESLEKELGEVKHYTLVHANRTEKNLEDIKRELVNLKDDMESKLDSQEEVVTNLIENYVEVKEELDSLQRDMNSTLYILQELQNQLITMIQGNSNAHQHTLPSSCEELHPNSPSGYYWLRGLSPKRVYCDMDRQSCGCGNPWGWMRVANIDMTDSNQQCPEGFRLRPGTSTRMCEMIEGLGRCTSTVFPTHSVQYSRVCGMVKAYQYATTDAFYSYDLNRSRTIDDQYVDGVSITHGQSPKKHIWTFAAATDETQSNRFTCPCTKIDTTYTGVVPPFIGNDYFCDTGSRQSYEYRLYIEDPLWDGEGCGSTSSCCQFNSPPWFCKELPLATNDDIEVRVCRDSYRYYEEIPFEHVELYVQ